MEDDDEGLEAGRVSSEFAAWQSTEEGKGKWPLPSSTIHHREARRCRRNPPSLKWNVGHFFFKKKKLTIGGGGGSPPPQHVQSFFPREGKREREFFLSFSPLWLLRDLAPNTREDLFLPLHSFRDDYTARFPPYDNTDTRGFDFVSSSSSSSQL